MRAFPFILLLLLPLQPLKAEPLGTKVNRFQLITKALKYPGLYRAAVHYMESVSFPKNDVLTCYWNTSSDKKSIFITNVLPDTTRTIHFTRGDGNHWKVSEI